MWACPPDEETCTWHVKGARKYASASWISNDLFKDSGVRLYGCDSADCFTFLLEQTIFMYFHSRYLEQDP